MMLQQDSVWGLLTVKEENLYFCWGCRKTLTMMQELLATVLPLPENLLDPGANTEPRGGASKTGAR